MKNLKINNQEESAIVHNAVIFMANDLMEEIVELEEYLKHLEEKRLVLPNNGKKEIEDQIADKKRRWELMVNICDRIKSALETSEVKKPFGGNFETHELDFDYERMEKEVKELLRGSPDQACPSCLTNPAVEKAFTANEISLKLYDAKFRSIIDGDQLFKLLDYFEEKKNED